MDYSKWDRLHVDDSDDDSPESDDEPELHATRQRPGMIGTESTASPQTPVDKSKAAAETLLRFKRVERIAEDVSELGPDSSHTARYAPARCCETARSKPRSTSDHKSAARPHADGPRPWEWMRAGPDPRARSLPPRCWRSGSR